MKPPHLPLTVPTTAVVLTLSLRILAADVQSFVDLPGGFIIGGHSAGKWLNSEQTGKALKAGTPYRLFTVTGEIGKATGAKAAPDADVCPDVWVQPITPEPEKNAIAVSAPWNPTPRKVLSADTKQEACVKAVSEILSAQGIKKPSVKITQHLRVDLDGDGEEEVLLAATHYPTAEGEGSAPMAAGAGNYSFVALRRVIAGKVVTQILEGEFYEKAQEFNAPNVHEVGGLLDLDGDGKMEVILHSQYYEGGGTTAWKLGPKKAVKVLEIACGV